MKLKDNLLHKENCELQSRLDVTLNEFDKLKLEYKLVVEKCREIKYKEEKDVATVHNFC